MDALLMVGGRGSRFDAEVEKPLFAIGGRPMVDRVLEALDASRVGTTYAVVSPRAPETRRHLAERRSIDTPGEGYVADLDRAIDRVERPVLSVAADLPLLDGAAVDRVLAAHESGSLTVGVPAAVKRRLGVSVDATLPGGDRELVPAGINVVGDGDDAVWTTTDPRFAVNVNRVADARVAEGLV